MDIHHFQKLTRSWMVCCFGEDVADDRAERNHRFLEEALELVQACECTKEEAYQLVEYVFGRPVGEVSQEIGGVMVTLAALVSAQSQNLDYSAITELARVELPDVMERIRIKQAAKPRFSPLPA